MRNHNVIITSTLRYAENDSYRRETKCNEQWEHVTSSQWVWKLHVIKFNNVINARRRVMNAESRWLTMRHNETEWVTMMSNDELFWVTMSHDESTLIKMSHHKSRWLIMSHNESPLVIMSQHDLKWVIICHHDLW